jgi:pyruvate/2-oxoglutarate dehydrogenase complex dihydrolipoamide dehydrogenase (E3) component
MSDFVDAIIIGTGQAGPSLARTLVKEGLSIAVTERKRFGGTCVNTGCIPTKTLIASARAAWVARNAAAYGVEIGGSVSVDMKKVRARKDSVAGASESAIHKSLQELKSCRVIEGHARFTGPHTIQVNGQTLEAPQIFINTGARASVPPIPGLSQIPYLTNSGMVDLDFLPEHLLILGGSYIALEFAQMYARFGSQVTVIERGQHLLSHEDPDISEAVRQILESEDIQVVTGAQDIRCAGPTPVISWKGGEATSSRTKFRC